MARPLRIEFPFALYHVTSRGNAKQDIFLNDHDRRDFLRILDAVTMRFNWLLYAYCMMNNHYHLIVETPDANLSKGMRQLNGEYAQSFNWWHNRVGHVFQSRYKAILVDEENYLLEVCRYVVLNPVRANFVLDPGEWQWSSYQATMGEGRSLRNLAINQLLVRFGSVTKSARQTYAEFVQEGIGSGVIWDFLRGQVFLGDENFVRRVSEKLRDKKDIQEIPRIQRYVERPSLDELLGQKVHANKRAVRSGILEAYHCGYTMSEIAERLGVHYTTVSRALRALEKGHM